MITKMINIHIIQTNCYLVIVYYFMFNNDSYKWLLPLNIKYKYPICMFLKSCFGKEVHDCDTSISKTILIFQGHECPCPKLVM